MSATNTSVLQDWLVRLPLRMQSTLLLSLRGPDTHKATEVKKIQRWMRGHVFKPANPHNVTEFMGTCPPEIVEKSPVAKELEFCTQHFYSHLLHGLEVLAYEHPDPNVQHTAMQLFRQMCALFHLPPESKYDFRERLKHLDWPQGQPNSFDDAITQLNSVQEGLLENLRRQK
jgi:hypothetical protein